MKLLLDETLGRSVASILQESGHDVVRSSVAAGPGADDDEVLAAAVADDRVLVTLDEGFANAVRFDPSGTPGIVVVSLPDTGHPDFAEVAPIDRMQASIVGVMRAAADLATERYRLQEERSALVEQAVALADHAAQAMKEGDERLSESFLARRTAVEAEIGKLDDRIGTVGRQEEETRAAAEDLSRHTQEARTAMIVGRAQALIDAAGVVLPAEPAAPPAADGAGDHQIVFSGTVVHAAEDRRTGWIDRRRAREGLLSDQLLPVWGSLARELARALSHLLEALDASDPRGRLWVAGVDGVKRYRDSA